MEDALCSKGRHWGMFAASVACPRRVVLMLSSLYSVLTLSSGDGRQQVRPGCAARQRVLARLRGVGDERAPHECEGAQEAARLLQLRQVVDGQRQLWGRERRHRQ